MCTLSFAPYHGGYHLLMNRDEQRNRPKGLPPRHQRCGELAAIYPSEPTGGTWIGSNERGLTLALINWYSKPQLKNPSAFSRGAIIPQLLSKASPTDAEALLRKTPLSQLNPFRLVMIYAKEGSFQEFKSDSITLEKIPLPWERTHWFSSGFDESEAMRIRGKTCSKESGEVTLEQLRELHRSHAPEKGPFSICMHRDDACTVSCTELSILEDTVSMNYHSGTPCVSDHLAVPVSLTWEP